MKNSDINIRDPYVVLHEGVYYLYGTRSATCWGPAEGFDCYTGSDLENWDGPFEIFHNDGSFWADRRYWTPECIYIDGQFYLVSTFMSEDRNMGVHILSSDSPKGPFVPYSEGSLTPEEWNCLDGTIYLNKNNKPYLVFGHAFEDVKTGEMYAVELSDDLKTAKGTPKLLFVAADAPWSVPYPNSVERFGIEGECFFVDGPCMHRTKTGRLIMLWSSWGPNGYAVGMAASDNGEIDGNWTHIEKPLYAQNGGHGMLFKDMNGELMYALHFPNDLYHEKPQFKKIKEVDDVLVLE